MSRFNEQERRWDSGATDEIHVLTALRVQSTASSRERTHKLDGYRPGPNALWSVELGNWHEFDAHRCVITD